MYFVGAGQLQVFDTASQTITAQTPIAGNAGIDVYAIALVAGGTEIYVSSGSQLQAFDSQTLQPIAINALPKVRSFGSLTPSPDGTTFYAVTPDSQSIVSVINTTTNTVITNIPYSNEGDILGATVSPDGQALYLTGPMGLFRFSAATNTLIGQIIPTPLNGQVAVSPDGSFVYVNRGFWDYLPGQPDSIGSNFPGLIQIDVVSGAVKNLPIGGVAVAEQTSGVSSSEYVLQTLPYVKGEDPDTMTITGTVGLAGGTEVLTASANGAVVAGISDLDFVTTPGSATISLINTAANRVIGQFTYTPPPGFTVAPYSFAINGDGTLGYIGIFEQSAPLSEQSQVAVLNLPAGSVNKAFPINTGGGYAPDFLALSPDGSSLYSVNGNGGEVNK